MTEHHYSLVIAEDHPLFRGALREAPYEVESKAPREDAERLLRSFLKKAYRRPADDGDA